MIISHQHRFIYFGPPRTGSTSLSKLFLESFGGEFLYRPACDRRPDRFLTEIGRAQHQICLPVEFSEYVTVLSIRNPYTRFLSLYSFFGPRYHCRTVEEYVPFAQPPIDWDLSHSCPNCVTTRVDHLIRLEAMSRDIALLPFVKSLVEVPHENERETELPLWTPRLVDFVNTFYRQDFLRFGYGIQTFDQTLQTAHLDQTHPLFKPDR